MSALIHVLGADIPHHNHSLLQFFNDKLAVDDVNARYFMQVSPNQALTAAFPALQIQTFTTQRQLARALLACARANPAQRFLLHGQFNGWIWLALASGILSGERVSWHIWGADLYQTAKGIKYRLFYWLRRRAQRRVAQVFATQGDLHYFAARCPQVARQLLYFPGKMPDIPARVNESTASLPDILQPPGERAADALLTVLVGNSGDSTNQHIAALQAIHRQWGDKLRLIIPMGYPAHNEHYIQQVEQAALALFPAEQIHILRQTMAFAEYWKLLCHCDVGYFLFARQQGVGTLSLLILANIPCVLHRDNPFCVDMQEQQLPVLFSDESLNQQDIAAARVQLQQRDKTQIAFFYPGYVPLWRQALASAGRGRQ